jgi:endonuclease/exonuclease/phosphatase family metal-dependent hydrolase
MGIRRLYRVVEGSLVTLFFLQTIRVVFAGLLKMTGLALQAGAVDLLMVNSHLLLLVALVPVWLSPRVRAALPATLFASAALVAVARIVVSLQLPVTRLYAGLAVIAFSGVYFASLLRANWRTWVTVIVVGLVFDQLLRAVDTFDLSMRIWLEVPIAGGLYRIPWFAVQIGLSGIAVIFGRLARQSARQEPYQPAFLDIWSGLALGAFIALEMVVLAAPSVAARWSSVAYAGLVPWMLLATALPLLPSIRNLVSDTLDMFDERVRGAVWLLAGVMLLVVGNRLSGLGAAAALIVAQFMAVLSLWWLPVPPDPVDVEQVGPNISLGLLGLVILIYLYGMAFVPGSTFGWMRGQGILVVLLAMVLVTVPRLFWREDNPWLAPSELRRSVAVAFVAPVAVFGLLLSSGAAAGTSTTTVPSTLRVASYNINGGYDAGGVFRLNLVARTIEASLADIVVLQEADTGSPTSYGVDEVEYLARRLDMYPLFLPTVEQVWGVAILSRWPLSDPATVLYAVGDLPGGALRGALVDPMTGRNLTLIGTQFTPGDDADRIEQLALVLSLLSDRTPAALAADFNAPPGSPLYEQLTAAASFADPDRVLGIEGGYTTPAVNPTIRHDMILVRGVEPLDSRQVDSVASDHRLVVVEVGWDGE